MSDLIDRQELQTQLDCVDRLRMITDERVIEVIPRWNVSKIIENLPSAEAVLKGTYEQVRWERDTALEQLKELGYSLGEKPRKSDLISRAEILDYIDNMPSELNAEGHRMIRRIRLTEYITDALPSAELQGKCNGCFYLDSNGATCEFCARNYPDRYSAKTEGEQNERLNKQTGCN